MADTTDAQLMSISLAISLSIFCFVVYYLLIVSSLNLNNHLYDMFVMTIKTSLLQRVFVTISTVLHLFQLFHFICLLTVLVIFRIDFLVYTLKFRAFIHL